MLTPRAGHSGSSSRRRRTFARSGKQRRRARRFCRSSCCTGAVPVVQTPEGLRALSKEKPVAPASVEKYLSSKFKDALSPVSAAMTELADSRDPEELASAAYGLYEQFRPAIPGGEAGWGAAGILSLAKIRGLAK